MRLSSTTALEYSIVQFQCSAVISGARGLCGFRVVYTWPGLPAVDHNGPGVGWVDLLDLLQELEHANGGEGHSEVRPAGEVHLGHQPGSLRPITSLLQETRDKRVSVHPPTHTWTVPTASHIQSVSLTHTHKDKPSGYYLALRVWL